MIPILSARSCETLTLSLAEAVHLIGHCQFRETDLRRKAFGCLQISRLIAVSFRIAPVSPQYSGLLANWIEYPCSYGLGSNFLGIENAPSRSAVPAQSIVPKSFDIPRFFDC